MDLSCLAWGLSGEALARPRERAPQRGAWGGNRQKQMGVTILTKKFYFAQEQSLRGHLTANPLLEGVWLSDGPCWLQGQRTGALRRAISWKHWQEESVASWALRHHGRARPGELEVAISRSQHTNDENAEHQAVLPAGAGHGSAEVRD